MLCVRIVWHGLVNNDGKTYKRCSELIAYLLTVIPTVFHSCCVISTLIVSPFIIFLLPPLTAHLLWVNAKNKNKTFFNSVECLLLIHTVCIHWKTIASIVIVAGGIQVDVNWLKFKWGENYSQSILFNKKNFLQFIFTNLTADIHTMMPWHELFFCIFLLQLFSLDFHFFFLCEELIYFLFLLIYFSLSSPHITFREWWKFDGFTT